MYKSKQDRDKMYWLPQAGKTAPYPGLDTDTCVLYIQLNVLIMVWYSQKKPSYNIKNPSNNIFDMK